MLTRLQKRLAEQRKKREELKKKMESYQMQQIERRANERFGKSRPMTPIEREKQDKEDEEKDASVLGKLAGRDCSKGKIQYENDNPGTVYAFGKPIVAKSSIPSMTTRRPTCKNCCDDHLKAAELFDPDKRKIFKNECLIACGKQKRETRTAENRERKSIMERKRSRQMTPSALNTLIGREQFANLMIRKKKENENNETKEVLRKLKRTGTTNNNRTKVGIPRNSFTKYYLKF